MLKKISDFPLIAYMAIRNFIQDLKRDEHGLEVVQVVLIILVGVVLISILIFLLREWLAELWAQITGTDVTTGTGGGF